MSEQWIRYQIFRDRVSQFFEVGQTYRVVAREGRPFEGNGWRRVDSIGVGVVNFVGETNEGRKIRTYLNEHELKDIRRTDYGFELWVDGTPYFGYERVPDEELKEAASKARQ